MKRKKAIFTALAAAAVLAGGGYAAARLRSRGAACAMKECPMEAGRTAGLPPGHPSLEGMKLPPGHPGLDGMSLPPGHPAVAEGERVPAPPLSDAQLSSVGPADCPYLAQQAAGGKDARAPAGLKGTAEQPVEAWLKNPDDAKGGYHEAEQ